MLEIRHIFPWLEMRGGGESLHGFPTVNLHAFKISISNANLETLVGLHISLAVF